MNIKRPMIGIFYGLMSVIGQAYADCPGAITQNASYCLYDLGMSTVSGDVKSANNQILAVSMYPFTNPSSAVELAYWRKQALAGLKAGKAYRDSLVLIDHTPYDGSAIAKMLTKGGESLNYATALLLGDSFTTGEARLIQARNTFAYHLYVGYPNADEAKNNLLDAVRTLASLYLMIGDEFLVDALEWRFSSETVGLNGKLDEQINLLIEAQTYYEKGVSAFVSGFSPAVGTNVYISDYFGDPEYSLFNLFNLGVERLSLTLREKSSKQLVRQMGSDPTEQWEDAWPEASQTLKSGALSVYLTTAAAARKQGASFNGSDANNTMTSALNALRKQGNIYSQRLNPLGYDNRYIPATDFENLSGQAQSELARARDLNAEFKDEDRQFDYLQSSLQSQWNGLASEYMNNLSMYTGCKLPVPLTDHKQLDNFRICTGEATNDLFNCRLALGDRFKVCLDAKTTKGLLASKYNDISIAQLRVDAAVLNRDNIIKQIEYENDLTSQKIQIQNGLTSANITYLDEYIQKLKGARSIVNTTVTTSGRIWNKDKKKWEDKPKVRDYQTQDSFTILDESLKLDIQKAEDLQKITLGFTIQELNVDTQNRIKNLLLDEAAAEIGISLAVQQKNSAIADFDNTLQEKENLWQLYQRGLAQINPDANNVAPVRVLRSQAAIALADALNSTAHYTYLSAKALEYKYVKTLENMSGINTTFIGDIFKAQTPDDFAALITSLDQLNKNQCTWNKKFLLKSRYISIRKDILGIFDDDPAAFTAFVNDHINRDGDLQFTFSISEDASFLRLSDFYNVKIWDGQIPCGSDTARGVGVVLIGGTGNYPTIRLKQSGHSSLRDSIGDIHQYIPISDFHFLFESSGDNYLASTEETITAFFSNPWTDGNGTGEWAKSFKGRSLSSSGWEITVKKNTMVDITKITDIELYFDTIVQQYNVL
ncbi:MAG: hypothetical protein Q7U57_01825 [Methylovulum sp.]|nr:hypothetical protein [Methylovulum sp.]